MSKIYAVIMAGGRGERFWPLSTSKLPKPFIPLLGASSLLQDTVARILSIVPLQNILISIGASHFEIAREQLPHIPLKNFIVEPIGRDTAACIGFCALHIEQRDPDAVLLVLPADHFVDNPNAYVKTLKAGIEQLPGSSGIVFGIKPDRPETGYGYILVEEQSTPADSLPVVKFVEKPDAERAKQFFASGNYFWNSGMFLWKNSTLLELFRIHMPVFHKELCNLRLLLRGNGSSTEISRIFSSLPRISIDFGIMEKTSGLRLVPAQFIWDDIGNWASLERALPADSRGNITQGACSLVDSDDCIIYAQKDQIAAFGVSGLVIVEAYGKVLVCPKDRASDLKQLVSGLGPHEG